MSVIAVFCAQSWSSPVSSVNDGATSTTAVREMTRMNGCPVAKRAEVSLIA